MLKFLTDKNKAPRLEWVQALYRAQERWFDFLDLTEAKMEELCMAAIPELELLTTADKITLYNKKTALNNKLKDIKDKAYYTYYEKINGYSHYTGRQISESDPAYRIISDFKMACAHRYHHIFKEKYDDWSLAIAKAAKQDLEAECREIMNGQFIPDTLTCYQCDDPMLIRWGVSR